MHSKGSCYTVMLGNVIFTEGFGATVKCTPLLFKKTNTTFPAQRLKKANEKEVGGGGQEKQRHRGRSEEIAAGSPRRPHATAPNMTPVPVPRAAWRC